MSNYDPIYRTCCNTQEGSLAHDPQGTDHFGFVEGFGTHQQYSVMHSCDRCGASVINTKSHLVWHEAQDSSNDQSEVSENDGISDNYVKNFLYDSESRAWACEVCGALVRDTQFHSNWHHDLMGKFDYGDYFWDYNDQELLSDYRAREKAQKAENEERKKLEAVDRKARALANQRKLDRNAEFPF